MLTELDIPCPRCKAFVGENCREGIEPFHYIEEFHKERADKILSMPLESDTNLGQIPTKDQFDNAVANILF